VSQAALSAVRIGTRGSALALWQAEHVKARLEALGHAVSLQVITTTGDRMQDRRLESVGGKGAFLKEIEEALLAREVDLAVHSLKDVPTALPPGLVLCAFLERADPRDALVSSGARLAELPPGAVVGTTSLRRRSLVGALRPDLRLEDLRGNVDTRLLRLREGRFDAVLLALAGLTRLGRAGEATEALDPRSFVPAPGQGAIALECRDDDAAVRDAVRPLHHEPTARAVAAERAFLAALGGGCNVPLGAHATHAGAELELGAFVASEDGRQILRGERRGSDPEGLGRAVADDLAARGARALIGA
jgi:hydroxymethylbilane synthase